MKNNPSLATYENGSYTIVLETTPNSLIATLYLCRKNGKNPDISQAVISLSNSKSSLENIITGEFQKPTHKKAIQEQKNFPLIKKGNILHHIAYALLLEQRAFIDHPLFHSSDFHPIEKDEVETRIAELKKGENRPGYIIDQEFLSRLFLSYNFNRKHLNEACITIITSPKYTTLRNKDNHLQHMVEAFYKTRFLRNTLAVGQN